MRLDCVAALQRQRQRWARSLLAVALPAVTVVACLEPTQITLRIETDGRCAELRTGIMAGEKGSLETSHPAAQTDGCKGPDYIGSIVAIPTEEDDAEVAFKVVTSVGVLLDQCYDGNFGPDCIEARRALRYIPSTPLSLPIAMRDSCRGVVCRPDETCVDGQCRPAATDPETCSSEPGCGEATLPGEPLVGWSKSWDTAVSEALLQTLPTNFNKLRPAVAIDAAGNVYVASVFAQSFDLDDEPVGPANQIDTFIASFTALGEIRWVVHPPGAGHEIPLDITVGDDGFVYVTGYYTATMSLGSPLLGSSGELAAFVAKLDPDSGAVAWATSHLSNSRLWYEDLVYAAGALYGAGAFELSAQLPGPQALQRSANSVDLLVARMSPSDGAVDWAIQSGGEGYEAAHAAAFDEAGLLHVAGSFFADVYGTETTIGGLPLYASGGSQEPDAFYATYERAGQWSFARGFTGIGNDGPVGVSVDRDGTACIGGYFAESLQVDPLQPGISGSMDLFLAWFPPSSAPTARTFGSAEWQLLGAMAADRPGRLYLQGYSVDAFQMGATELATAQGVPFLFVAVLDRDTGDPRWTRALPLGGATYNALPTGIAGRHGNELFVTGLYQTTIEFEDAVRNAGNDGAFDTYLARIVHNAP